MSELPMRDSRIPSRTSQDGNLRDALATALHRWDVSAPANLYVGDFYPLAEHVLADPAFRAALDEFILATERAASPPKFSRSRHWNSRRACTWTSPPFWKTSKGPTDD